MKGCKGFAIDWKFWGVEEVRTVNRGRWLGIMLVLLAGSFWGMAGTVAQRLFQEKGVSVNWLVTVRLLLAGLMLIFLSLLFKDRGKVWKIWREGKAVFQIFVFALVGMLPVQYTYMESIPLGNAAVATMLQYLAPIFIIVYLVMTCQTKLSMKDLIAVTLAVLGTFLLLTNGSLESLEVPFAAVIWGILSGVALAFYTLYPRNLLRTWGSMNVIGWSMILAGIGMGIFHPPWQVDPFGWGADTYLYICIVIIFGTMLAFWFYLESLKYLSPQETSLLANVEPLTAIFASVLWLKIPFGIWQAVGSVLILGMVIYLTTYKEKKEEIPDLSEGSHLEKVK